MKIIKISLFLIFILNINTAFAKEKFTIYSPDFKNNQRLSSSALYNKLWCSGDNIAPTIQWKNAPKNTKSFVLTMHDPDAPTGGGGFWHWVVYDIPANVNKIVKGEIPKNAKMALNDLGEKEYMGPCPPTGDPKHRYVFTIYALNVEKIELQDMQPTAAIIGFTANHENFLASATITGTEIRI